MSNPAPQSARSDGVVREACPVPRPRRSRRELLKMLPLAGAALLIDPSWRARAIRSGLALSDRASAMLDPMGLAPTYSDRDVTPIERYPLNSYLTHEPEIDLDEWRLTVDGLVRKPGEYSLDAIRGLPRVSQNTRHICIEGWDVVGSFGGVRLGSFLAAIGADPAAQFVEFRCADDYYESLDMPSARHPQSLLCGEMYGRPLTREHGAPLRLVPRRKID